MFKSLLFMVCIFLMVSCSTKDLTTPQNNPVLAPWSGPYQGLPPFTEIAVDHFSPALTTAMAKALASYEKIANDPSPPSFANTIDPMEQVSLELERPMILYAIWNSSMSSPELQEVEKKLAPQIAEFEDKVIQNGQLFARIELLYKERQKQKYSPEQERLLWQIYTQFVKKGGALDGTAKKQVAEINQQLAKLYTEFSQNQLKDEENDYLHITKESDLEGLPQWLKDTAKADAKRRSLVGWTIANTRSSMQPFLTFSPNRQLREKAFKVFQSRGDNNNANDNKKLVTQILNLRAKRSKLLGYQTFAHWQLSDQMAKTPDKALKLMKQVWSPAIRQVTKDVKSMQNIIDKEKGGFKLAAWDYRYYAEKLRKERYDFDEDMVKPYLQLDNIRTAMFYMAEKLYGFKFSALNNMPVYHPDMSVYQVTKNGKEVGLWFFDPYARNGKRSGAWMNAYRIQNRLGGTDTIPIVSNNSNFIKSTDGTPTTISWDDATTMFHEFGHALHGLSSNVTYPSLAGTRTARDFVEFPSQIHEDWLSTKEVLNILKDNKGEPLPQQLVEKIKRAATFNEGFTTTEYLSSALVDLELHLAGEQLIDPITFEKTTLNRLKMPKEIVMRHRIPHFGHVFSGEDYAAGYYSYLWSDVLRRDAFGAFLEGKGPYDKAVAEKFQKHILSIGNTVDPETAYRQFRGRGPKVEALLKAKGFIGVN